MTVPWVLVGPTRCPFTPACALRNYVVPSHEPRRSARPGRGSCTLGRSAHLDPPTSPSRLLRDPGGRLVAVAGVFSIALAAAAAIDGGGLLLHIDEPIGRFVVTHRTDFLDTFFSWVSFLGSTKVVLLGGVVLALLAWRKCHMVALLVVAATLSRPLVEHTLKISVQRGRPSIDRMVNGRRLLVPQRPRHGRRHPLADGAAGRVALHQVANGCGWRPTIASVTLVVLIAASRVDLGVHWPIDVMAGGPRCRDAARRTRRGVPSSAPPPAGGDARRPVEDDDHRPVDDIVTSLEPELVA